MSRKPIFARGKSPGTFILFAFSIGLTAAKMPADRHLHNPNSADKGDIVVTARRSPARDAITDSITSSTIKGYATNSVGELIARMKARFGGREPALLVNGRRLGSYDAILSLPPEALEHIDILALSAAGRYGFDGSSRVVNLVLRPKFQFIDLESANTITTEGGADFETSALRYAFIRKEKRINAALTYNRQGGLLETDRAGVSESGTDANYRSLLPHQDAIVATGGYASPIGKANLDVSAETGWSRSMTLMGLGIGPQADTTTPVVLDQIGRTQYARASTTISGNASRLFWSLAGSADLSQTHIVNATGAPLAISSSSALIGVALPSPSSNVSSYSRGFGLAANLSGPIVAFPAGSVSIDLRVSSQLDHIVNRVYANQIEVSGNPYKATSEQANIRIPITDNGHGLLPWLGSLSVTQEINHTGAARIGAATGFNSSIDWSPTPALQVSLSRRLLPNLPSATLRYGPVVTRSGYLIYDAVSDAIVPISVTTGGTPTVHTTVVSDTTLMATYQKNLRFAQISGSMSYIEDQTKYPLIALNNPTPEAQRLLPQLFERNPAGILIGFDARPINGTSENARRVTTGVHLTGIAPSRVVKNNSASLKQNINWDVGVSYTRTIEDKIGLGGRTINLLENPLNVVSTSPARHQIDAQWTISTGRFGMNGSLSWRSGTEVRALDTAADQPVRYSSLTKIDLECYWEGARSTNEENPSSLRITVGVGNLLNQRERITGYQGLDKNLQAAVIDPLGRTLKITLRKSL